MAIGRCVNGHFYDMNKSKECPYCIKRNNDSLKFNVLGEKIPDFRSGSNDIGESVTVAMPKGGTSNVMLQQGGDRKTAAIEGISASGDSVTVGMFSSHRGRSYVTGWLVVREGPDKGKDYRIGHGMNWLGSSQNMQICVYAGEGIAPMKHCALVYDGRGNKFFIVAGSGTITYLNGTLLEGSQELHLGDEITIGRSKYEFIPFCREGHVWEEEY